MKKNSLNNITKNTKPKSIHKMQPPIRANTRQNLRVFINKQPPRQATTRNHLKASVQKTAPKTSNNQQKHLRPFGNNPQDKQYQKKRRRFMKKGKATKKDDYVFSLCFLIFFVFLILCCWLAGWLAGACWPVFLDITTNAVGRRHRDSTNDIPKKT